MKIRPLRGQILGQVIGGEYITGGGIIVPDTRKSKKVRKVRVAAIGEFDGYDENGWWYVNDEGKEEHYRAYPYLTAWIKLAEGKKLRHNGKDYLILENKDIVAVELL